MAEVRSASFGELDVRTLYALLKLRADVFVVEQKCVYADLDGLDEVARHFWVDGDEGPLAYLRVLDEPDGARIGRVVVHPSTRRNGLANALMEVAVKEIGDDRDCVLNAQAHLAGFYARFGFTTTGPEFLDDGIPHFPMRRSPDA